MTDPTPPALDPDLDLGSPAIDPDPPLSADPPWPSDATATPAPRTGPRRLAALGFVGAVALGAAIGAAVFGLATGTIGAPAPSPSPAPTAQPTAEPTAVPAAPVGNTFGRADAPVTIDVWADYQCPYCRLEDLLFSGAIDREYVTPGIVRVVYRDFAFLGPESIDAAVASRCAGAQEPAAQLRYHDALYTFQQGENKGRFARENLVQVAVIAGVPSKDAFTACLDDPAVAKAVTDETLAGRNVGVTSTPTLRLRGPGGERVLTGFSQTWPPLREAIEAVRVPASPSPSPSAPPSGSPAPSPAGSPIGSTAPSPSP
jgi:protein-disulfide isomerase